MSKEKQMNRRRFLKLASSVGLGATCGMSLNSQLFAATDNYAGPLWIMINAEGGWDVTSLCDPKGYNGLNDANNPDRLNNYDSNRIGRVGNLSYAPVPDDFLSTGIFYDANLYSAKAFFEKYYQRLLVMNGIDCQTNSHDNGQLYNFSGRLLAGYPSFSAIVSGSLAAQLPLSFLTNGGYSAAAGLVTPVRMSNSSLRALYEIAYPNRSSNPKLSSSRVYLPDEIEALIASTSAQRHQSLLQQQNLPRIKKAIEQLQLSRSDTSKLQGLADNLENQLPMSEVGFNGRDRAYRLYEQGRVALAAYQQGLTASVNVHMSGFDTHAKHDEYHYPLLMDLLQGVDAILEEARLRGLQNKIVVVIASDFGRANKYNKEKGKDHWPISSALFLGNATQIIRGNRVIGATDANHKAFQIDPLTLQPDVTNSNIGSIKLTPAHFHLALRRLAGVENLSPAIAYPINVEQLNLFI